MIKKKFFFEAYRAKFLALDYQLKPGGSNGALGFLFDMRLGAFTIESFSSSSSPSLFRKQLVFAVGPFIYKSSNSRPIFLTSSPDRNTC
jgi:hypothetical protein